jgi:hypothetical protein
MSNETLVTSSGVIRNRSIPRVGIINASSLYDDLFQDCLNEGIDLVWEEYREELLARGLEEDTPEWYKETDNCSLETHNFLLGAWIKDTNGQYSIDKSGKSGDYALSYNTETGIVCVEWSLYTMPCNNTSPCYVLSNGDGPCGDLDSPGDAVIAYTLPGDMFSGYYENYN